MDNEQVDSVVTKSIGAYTLLKTIGAAVVFLVILIIMIFAKFSWYVIVIIALVIVVILYSGIRRSVRMIRGEDEGRTRMKYTVGKGISVGERY